MRDPIFESRLIACSPIWGAISGIAANGGWYFSLDDDNTPHDATKDLYSHAFIMFGLAHYLAIFADKDALD